MRRGKLQPEKLILSTGLRGFAVTKTLRSKRQLTNAFTMANLLYQPGKKVNIINTKLAPNWPVTRATEVSIS